jgi:hypothetical protein
MTAAAALSEQEPPRAGSCEQRNVSREPGEVSRETREERRKGELLTRLATVHASRPPAHEPEHTKLQALVHPHHSRRRSHHHALHGCNLFDQAARNRPWRRALKHDRRRDRHAGERAQTRGELGAASESTPAKLSQNPETAVTAKMEKAMNDPDQSCQI